MIDERSNKKSIRERVLEAVKGGDIKMKPKWHFVLRAVLGIIGACILLFAILYLASFIIFILRRTGVWFVPVFGSRGWFEFLLALPWLLILLSLAFIAVLEVFVRKYSFAYRRPMLYSVLTILFLAIVGGFVVASTPLHGRIFRYAEEHQLPFARPFYRQFGDRGFENIHPGKVTGVTQNGFTIQSRGGEALTVVVTSATRLPLGGGFEAGDFVVVFGERASNTVQAFGVRKITEMEE
jgi:hypothetical protein